MTRCQRILHTYCTQCAEAPPAVVLVDRDAPTMPWKGEALCAEHYAAALAAEAES